MAVSNPASLSSLKSEFQWINDVYQIETEFGAGLANKLSSYSRGGFPFFVLDNPYWSGVSSTTAGLALSQFNGKSSTNDYQQKITVGSHTDFGGKDMYTDVGYVAGLCGSITPGTVTLGGTQYTVKYAMSETVSGTGITSYYFGVVGYAPNSGWTSVTLGDRNGLTFNRADAAYSYNSGANFTMWYVNSTYSSAWPADGQYAGLIVRP